MTVDIYRTVRLYKDNLLVENITPFEREIVYFPIGCTFKSCFLLNVNNNYISFVLSFKSFGITNVSGDIIHSWFQDTLAQPIE